MRKKNELPIFRKVEGFGISLFVIDKSKKVSRTLKTEFQSYSGADIKLANTNISMIKKYVLTFKQKHYSPEVSNCVDYPSEKYESYEECDRLFVYKKMIEKYNMVPFWSAESVKTLKSIER